MRIPERAGGPLRYGRDRRPDRGDTAAVAETCGGGAVGVWHRSGVARRAAAELLGATRSGTAGRRPPEEGAGCRNGRWSEGLQGLQATPSRHRLARGSNAAAQPVAGAMSACGDVVIVSDPFRPPAAASADPSDSDVPSSFRWCVIEPRMMVAQASSSRMRLAGESEGSAASARRADPRIQALNVAGCG